MSEPFGEPYGGPYDGPTADPPPAPYGGYHPYGAGTAPAGTDGISIAALVCSLTCCAAPVGIGLAIAGLVRTKDGRRTGRWAAVTGLVVGILATLALVASVVGLVWYGTNTVFVEDARAGDCIDVGETDIWKAECDEPHDAEVVHARRFDEELVSTYDEAETDAEFCAPLATESGYGYVVLEGDHDLWPWIDSWTDEPEAGDHFICLAQGWEGNQMEAPLPRDAAGTR